MRCFIAIDLPPPLKNPLIRLLRQNAARSRGLRWSSESQLHVTLKFLGEIDAARVDEIRPLLAAIAAGCPPFPLQLGDLGCFPTPRDPRVLWCGLLDESRGLSDLAGRVELSLAGLGFEPERRPFAAHVTLARVKAPEGGRTVRSVIESQAALAAVSAPVTELTFFESQLSTQGARYRVIDAFRLDGVAPT
ncbi:2'-5'-RNA ligase [Phycisphaerae bacterium RAS1]|nr:2'-5'-RNA ligase [Phycisphaerae bacterium RAS1]